MQRNLRLSFYLFVILGFFISVFFLFPIHDFVSYHELSRGLETQILSHDSAQDYVFSNLVKTVTGQRIIGTCFFGLIGICLSIFFYIVFKNLQRRNTEIQNLKKEIERDINLVLEKGEGMHLEFKSSFRWDYKKQKINKVLEVPIVKTIAGFMNSEGGSLIIGVDDNAHILGLNNDYQTLKVKNRDGFEVAIMTAVAANIGANNCTALIIIFHEVDEKEICQILVSKTKKPVFVKAGNNLKFYIRTGAGTRELNVKEAADHIQDHW